MTIELDTRAGTIYSPYSKRDIPAEIEEEMSERSYQFIQRILSGLAAPNDYLRRVLRDKVFPIQTSEKASRNAIPLYLKLSLFLFLDHLEQSPTFQYFKEKADVSWSHAIRRMSEAEFDALKVISPRMKDFILKDEIPSVKIPSLKKIAAWTILENLDRYIPNTPFCSIFQDAIDPEVSQVITDFQERVDNGSIEDLKRFAREVRQVFMSHQGNIVAAHAKWSILLKCRKLPKQAYNDLLFAAVFSAYSQKVKAALNSPHFDMITVENAGEALFQLVANLDHENASRLQHFLPLLSDGDFLGILNKVVTDEDPGMVALLKPYLSHIYQLKPLMNPWTKHQVRKLYPPEDSLDGLIRIFLQML